MFFSECFGLVTQNSQNCYFGILEKFFFQLQPVSRNGQNYYCGLLGADNLCILLFQNDKQIARTAAKAP